MGRCFVPSSSKHEGTCPWLIHYMSHSVTDRNATDLTSTTIFSVTTLYVLILESVNFGNGFSFHFQLFHTVYFQIYLSNHLVMTYNGEIMAILELPEDSLIVGKLCFSMPVPIPVFRISELNIARL